MHIDLIRMCQKRIHCRVSDHQRKLVTREKQTVYCGFDPTARSLHIGNLVGECRSVELTFIDVSGFQALSV